MLNVNRSTGYPVFAVMLILSLSVEGLDFPELLAVFDTRREGLFGIEVGPFSPGLEDGLGWAGDGCLILIL